MIKHLICLLSFITLPVFAQPWLPPDGKVTLEWNYPPSVSNTGLTFKLYYSTNVAVPMTNWTVLTNISGTNLSVEVQVVPGENFFTLTASNFWGESLFSNVAFTPPLPGKGSNVIVHRK